MDYQVKIRGFRIEPGEIEAALTLHPDIREVVVAARQDRGTKYLAAYFTTRNGREPDSREMREFASRSLPAYMIPSYFVKLAALPRTPNGKAESGRFAGPGYSRTPAGEDHSSAAKREREEIDGNLRRGVEPGAHQHR